MPLSSMGIGGIEGYSSRELLKMQDLNEAYARKSKPVPDKYKLTYRDEWVNGVHYCAVPPGYTEKNCIFFHASGDDGSYGMQDHTFTSRRGSRSMKGVEDRGNYREYYILCCKAWNINFTGDIWSEYETLMKGM